MTAPSGMASARVVSGYASSSGTKPVLRISPMNNNVMATAPTTAMRRMVRFLMVR